MQAGLDQVQHEDGGGDRGGAPETAAQLRQDPPALERGHSPLAERADTRMGLVDRRLPVRQAGPRGVSGA